MMRKLCVVIGVISAFLVAISIQCSAEDNVIYGCIGKKGILRVVSEPSECKELETAIYWNKVGPQGPTGPQGEQGPQGEVGPEGPPGPGVATGEQFLNMPAVAFFPIGPIPYAAQTSWDLPEGFWGRIPGDAGTVVHLYAPVYLPDGAIVTEFSVRYYDNSVDEELWVRLHLVSKANWEYDGFYMVIEEFNTHGEFASPDIQSAVFTDINYSTINNRDYSYGIHIRWAPSGKGAIHFHGCRITYTLTTVAP